MKLKKPKLIRQWKSSEEEQLKGKENTKKKAESDKAQEAEEVRLRVTEKLSEIKKRKNNEEDYSLKPKKTRRSKGETVEFLRSITSFAKNSCE